MFVTLFFTGGAAGADTDHPDQRDDPVGYGLQLFGLLQAGSWQEAGHRALGAEPKGALVALSVCLS
jgi:hypothetical protein